MDLLLNPPHQGSRAVRHQDAPAAWHDVSCCQDFHLFPVQKCWERRPASAHHLQCGAYWPQPTLCERLSDICEPFYAMCSPLSILHYPHCPKDRLWSGSLKGQVIGRIWRPPQKKMVHVYNVVATNTQDVFLDNLSSGKVEIMDAFAGATPGLRQSCNCVVFNQFCLTFIYRHPLSERQQCRQR
jgi:hypothetical protein